MELEDALFHFVSAQPTITQFIGEFPQPVRFYKGKAPQGTKSPFSVEQRSGAARQQLYCSVDGSVRVSMQIDHYANTWAEMAALAKAWFRAFRADVVSYPVYMGAGDSPLVAVKVKSAHLENEFDSEDIDPGLHRRTQLWTFWIWEQ